MQALRNEHLRSRALRSLRSRTDIFWVIDAPSLPPVVRAVEGTASRIVYETVDLVPEYHYSGEEYRLARLEEERRALPSVSGFITACDSYADYYWERYGGTEIQRRPFVRDNMPATISPSIRKTARPLRLLFLGSLMFDRPVVELIEAISLVTSEVTLTFQGKNLIGDGPLSAIGSLHVQDRVFLRDPCPPEEIVNVANQYDVGIIALRGENENERRASTSKLFTYMSAGLAMLGSDLPGIARVVNKYEIGELVQGIEPASWAHAIEAIAQLSDDSVDAMKQRSLDAAHAHSWDRQRDGYIAQFVNALGATRAGDPK